MDVLMLLFVVIGIAASIANKKNTAKAQKQRQAMQGREAAAPKPGTAQNAPNRTSPTKASSAPSKYPPAGPSKFPPAAPSKRTTAAQRPQPKPVAPTYGGTPKYTHVVTSTLEGGHTHTESSMTGEEVCPPPKAVLAKQPEEKKTTSGNAQTLLNFQPGSVLQGVLFAEILGKPKALQRQ